MRFGVLQRMSSPGSSGGASEPCRTPRTRSRARRRGSPASSGAITIESASTPRSLPVSTPKSTSKSRSESPRSESPRSESPSSTGTPTAAAAFSDESRSESESESSGAGESESLYRGDSDSEDEPPLKKFRHNLSRHEKYVILRMHQEILLDRETAPGALLHARKATVDVIARYTGHAPTTIKRIVANWKRHGAPKLVYRLPKDRRPPGPGSGAAPKLSADAKQWLASTVRKARETGKEDVSRGALANEIATLFGISVHRTTVGRTLKQMGL